MLQVYDGFDETATELFKGCNADLPDPVISSSNIVYIVFDSHLVHLGSKFLLEWLQVDRQISSVTVRPSTSEYQGVAHYTASLYSHKSSMLNTDLCVPRRIWCSSTMQLSMSNVQRE